MSTYRRGGIKAQWPAGTLASKRGEKKEQREGKKIR